MRCKPNDLCEIVRAGDDTQHLIGTRVVVTHASLLYGVPAWDYVAFDGRPLFSDTGRMIWRLEDHCLRPIPPDEEPEAIEVDVPLAEVTS